MQTTITIFLITIFLGCIIFFAVGRLIRKAQKGQDDRIQKELGLHVVPDKKGTKNRKVPPIMHPIHDVYPLSVNNRRWQFKRQHTYYVIPLSNKNIITIGIVKDEEYPANFQNHQKQKTIALEYQPKIILKKERGIDVSTKEIGLVKEFQTGDRIFDDAIFIVTDAPDSFLRDLFASSVLRHTILRLFKNYNTKKK